MTATPMTPTAEETMLYAIAKMIPGVVSTSGKIQFNQIVATLEKKFPQKFPQKQPVETPVGEIKIGDSVILMSLSKDDKGMYNNTDGFDNTVVTEMLPIFGTGNILEVRDVSRKGIAFNNVKFYYPPQLCHKVHKPSDFKIGMTVQLVDIPGSKGRFDFTEEYNNTWVASMSDAIGKTGIVVSVCETTGIIINFPNKINFAYPAQMLKIVSAN